MDSTTEEPLCRAVLNSQDSAPLVADRGNPFPQVPEHALSLSLTQSEHSLGLPTQTESLAMVSEGFKSLESAADEDSQRNSPVEEGAAAGFTDGAYNVPKPSDADAKLLQHKTWHPATPERRVQAAPPPPRPSVAPTVHPAKQEAAEPFTPPRGRSAPPTARVLGSAAVRRADEENASAVARERDVAAAFSGLPRVTPRWTHHHLKILLVGDDGLGKTTFVRNLFAAYASDVDFPVADASHPGAAATFRSHPERLCTELVVKDDAAQTWWHYLVQDTPGYGDFDGPEDAEEQRSAILDHLRCCSARYYDAEVDSRRDATLDAVPDARVDVALYFVPPHRLRRTDVRFMQELAGQVPVVPLLAKADTMTREELQEHRAAVRTVLARTGTSWQFSSQAMEEAGSQQGPPFAIVAANTVDRAVGRFWPVRRYPWGRCEALLTAHSDLPALRRLLLESGYWEVKANTEARYWKFRAQEYAERANPVPRPLRALMHLLGGAAAVVAVAFAVVNAGPMLKDDIVRKEAVRRVKDKVSHVVGSTVESVQDVKGRAEEAKSVAHSAVSAAADTTKQFGQQLGQRAVQALETDEIRDVKEAELQREGVRRKPWWQFMRNGGGLE